MDLEKLLDPIDEAAPSGPNLRMVAGDLTISKLTELRRTLDPVNAPDGVGKDPNWPGLVELAQEALAEKTKDLEIAAYLAEGLVRTEGFPGLLAGLQLFRELIDRYWDSLHPGRDPDSDEISGPIRGKWFKWIGASKDFLDAVGAVPITGGPGIEARGWTDYINSERVDSAGIRSDQTAYQELLSVGLISGSMWKTLVAGTPPDRLAEAVGVLRECESTGRALEELAEEKFPEGDAPSLLELLQMLDACREHLEGFLSGIDPGPAGGAGEEAVSMVTSGGGGAPAVRGPGGPIQSRDEAYRRLREVAEYLRRTEPHSPVSALLDRAVNWGGLSFQELVLDVLRHQDDARDSIFETLGITIEGSGEE